MNFKKNVGKEDGKYRMYIGAALALFGIITQNWIVGAIGLVLVVTGYYHTCLAYIPFDIDTSKK